MSPFEIGLAMFAAALILIALRMPVGGAMLLCGALGYAAMSGWGPLFATLKTLSFSRFSNYSLSVVPLFVLMGELATRGRLSESVYRAARAWFGHWRGGLAISTIGACAAFGAICGSSLATAATMTRVAEPEMRRHGYSPALATGSLAAGGTLGILIPPSVILVIYAIYTEQSIGALFVAAIVPGVLAALGYVVVIATYVRLVPGSSKQADRATWKERLAATHAVWPTLTVFLLVVVGIYRGWYSPTESAAIGVAAVLAIAVVQGGLRWRGFVDSVLATAETSAMMYLILLGAELFSAALALTQLPNALAGQVAALNLAPMVIVVVVLAIYLLLGCFMESLAMVLLTLPVFVPLMLALDLGMTQSEVLIWFGILVLVTVEVGLISPPFGLNLFVINSITKDVPMIETYRGVLGFCLSDLLRLAALVAFPALALWLPGSG